MQKVLNPVLNLALIPVLIPVQFLQNPQKHPLKSPPTLQNLPVAFVLQSVLRVLQRLSWRLWCKKAVTTVEYSKANVAGGMHTTRFVQFIRRVSAAAGDTDPVDEEPVIASLSSDAIIRYLRVWGVMHGAIDFCIFDINVERARANDVARAIVAGCARVGCARKIMPLKRSQGGSNWIRYFVYSQNAEDIAAWMSESVTGDVKELRGLRAARARQAMGVDHIAFDTVVMTAKWSVHEGRAKGDMFSQTVPDLATAVLAHDRRWTKVLRLIHPDLRCELQKATRRAHGGPAQAALPFLASASRAREQHTSRSSQPRPRWRL